MPKGYSLSRLALRDLEQIWEYTVENWSESQADKYYHQIIAEIEWLARHPSQGRPQHSIREGYRSSKVQSHIIFYQMAGEEIKVIRILHERMDIPNRLRE